MPNNITNLRCEWEPEPDANWKKMYITMLSAADKALSSIERGNIAAAVELLKNAMLACEDEYINNV